MDDSSANTLRLRAEQLIHRMLDYSLTDAEHAELGACLQQDPAARELFLQHTLLHAALRDRCETRFETSLCSRLFGVRQEEIPGLAPLTVELLDRQTSDKEMAAKEMAAKPVAAAPVAPCQPPVADGLTDPGTSSLTRSWGLPGAFGLLGALFCAILMVGVWAWLHRNAGPGDVRNVNAVAKGPPKSGAPNIAAEYVARIIKASTDCVWADKAGPAEFLLRVRAGDRMELVAGLVELEFRSGAHVILHGPTEFTPTGPASGQLDSGRLTGEASNGNFRLLTPAAEVVDLGTAFGVVADATAGTDVVVFDGKVQVMSRSEASKGSEMVNMTEGMAARFRFDGTAEFGLKTEGKDFARQISPSGRQDNPDEICLIDVIAGGNGLGANLAGAIDPLNGQRDYGEQGRKSKHYGRWTDGAFHDASWHPLIDGVFVPFPTGHSIQIDSRGRTLDLPTTTGTTHGSIWARRKESISAAGSSEANHSDSNSGLDNDFWGTRTLKGIVNKLKQTQIGLVGMHSNVGITFDLRALQMAHRRIPAQFRTRVANIENSADWAIDERPVPEVATRIADCRVFVDGSLRCSQVGFRREDGDLQLTATLSPGDRFLTILVTDGDGEMRFDHIVLIDPVISLMKE